MDAAEYCRLVEAYLCQKNGGHLIRIVGPAFELVAGWARQGIPFTMACRGIDRTIERDAAKGPRRRPVRIEFCEADVLDAFDEWRRAVGVGRYAVAAEAAEAAEAAQVAEDRSASPPPSRRRPPTLPAHLDRVILRLSSLRAAAPQAPALATAMDRVLADLDAIRRSAARSRGTERDRLLDELTRLDDGLIEAARESAPDAVRSAIADEVRLELAPFRERMPPGSFETSVRAAENRLLREHFGLPQIRLE